MSTKCYSDREKKHLDNLKKLQLPNAFKRVGWIVLAVSFLMLFVNAFMIEVELVRNISRMGMLLGLLIVSISKESVEDELVTSLRAQSYSFAFIIGVIYALVLPFVDYLVDAFITHKEPSLNDLGDFTILWLLLCIQICYYEYLKRMFR